MGKFVLIFLIVFLFPFMLACEDGQIDINTASLEELDQLYGIGPVKAQAIIEGRSFESVDDLINVIGIGEITLNNIISQGLACVEDNSEEERDVQENEIVPKHLNQNITNEESEKKTPTPSEIINLNPQDIKTEKDNEDLDKNDYAIYGFLIFCILLGILFTIKNVRNKKYQSSIDL